MFVKFPKIGKFSDMVYKARKARYSAPSLSMGAKIKLHGTNACVRIEADGTVAAQSRNRDLSLAHDNADFCSFVESNKTKFSKLVPMFIYGEWAGPGVQSGVAVSELSDKKFFVFCIHLVDGGVIVEPDQIKDFVHGINESIEVLPWYGDPVDVRLHIPESLQSLADFINSEIESIDKVDPYIRDNFGITGPGEGLVFTLRPENGEYASWEDYQKFIFKAKGESHSVHKTKAPVTISPEKIVAKEKFVSTFVTEERLEQGMQENSLEFTERNIGPFLKWLGQDIQKESEVERESNPNLPPWKVLWSGCTQKAVGWFKEKCYARLD